MINELIIGSDKTLRRSNGIPFMDIRGQFHLLDMKGNSPVYIYRSQPMDGMSGRPGELTVKCSLSSDLKQSALPAVFFIHHVLNFLRGKKPVITDHDVAAFNASEELEQMVDAFNNGDAHPVATWGIGADSPELPGILDTYEYTRRPHGRYIGIETVQSCGHGGLLALMISTAETGAVSIAPCGVDSASFAQALARTGDILILGRRSQKAMQEYVEPKGLLGRLLRTKQPTVRHTLRLPEEVNLPDFIHPVPFHIAHRIHAMKISHKEWSTTADDYSIELLKVDGLQSFESRSLAGVVISLITIFNTMMTVGSVEWKTQKGRRLVIKSSDGNPILSLDEEHLTTMLPEVIRWDEIHTFIDTASALAGYLKETNVKRMRMIRHV